MADRKMGEESPAKRNRERTVAVQDLLPKINFLEKNLNYFVNIKVVNNKAEVDSARDTDKLMIMLATYATIKKTLENPKMDKNIDDDSKKNIEVLYGKLEMLKVILQGIGVVDKNGNINKKYDGLAKGVKMDGNASNNELTSGTITYTYTNPDTGKLTATTVTVPTRFNPEPKFETTESK